MTDGEIEAAMVRILLLLGEGGRAVGRRRQTKGRGGGGI